MTDDAMDTMIRDRAARRLLTNGGIAVALALLSWCFNPLWVTTILAVVSGAWALTDPDRMKKTLEGDYPESAGTASKVLGVVAIVLAVGTGALGLF